MVVCGCSLVVSVRLLIVCSHFLVVCGRLWSFAAGLWLFAGRLWSFVVVYGCLWSLPVLVTTPQRSHVFFFNLILTRKPSIL